MNKGLKVVAALVGLVSACAMVEMSTGAALSSARGQVCGCGDPSCGGSSVGGPQNALVSTVYGAAVEVGTHSGLGCQSCQKCQTRQTPTAPAAPCQYCELNVKQVEEDKSGFKIEQKEVCIPAIRFPWMKGCPPKRSRVRTVNVLKKDKYKSKTCEYKWSVHEPEEYGASSQPTPSSTGSGSKSSGGSGTRSSGGSGSKRSGNYPDPSIETRGALELSDPNAALGEIPRPPLE